ncbi:solute carrier organic anion transporter family member 3A1-like [Patiria miniata]|uniref:Solute carrier organic anion transporter family member n=1 Tax=Patiria miniata TaxID=46514 RepID=A0A913ZKW0_PATMI|nr:solute carrier organic anion transporter family member 3A1-like [Patiria miniata]
MGFFNRPVAFGFCFALFTCVQVTVGLYIAGVLTTLEKQYRITTSVAGLVLSTSDFASLVSIPLVSYVGSSMHRPRIVGVLGLLTAVGGILSGMPHILYPSYRDGEAIQAGNGTSTIYVCDAARGEENCSAEDIDESGSRINEMWALLLGQCIMGFAYGPLFPIALTYIDDQVKGTTTPYYIAAILTAGTSATLVGFGEGYLFLSMWVDWPAQYYGQVEWLGAWWMGFFVNGALIGLLSIPFFFFPKEMDVEINQEDIPKEKLAMEGKEGESKLGAKDFFMASKRLFCNFVFMALLVGSIFDLAVAASFGFFMAKFLQVQFNIPAAQSSLYVGIIITPAAFLGNFSGGFLVKKLNLDSKGCGKVILVLNVIVMACIPVVYFLSCPVPTYAGNSNGEISTTNPCNKDCTCTGSRYEPVCGHDGLVYATPCFAGCTGEQQNQTDDPMVNITVYTGCSCSSNNATDSFSQQVVTGQCLAPCNMIYYCGIFLFCIVLFGTPAKNPLLMVTMRCAGDDKTYALGMQSLFGRALGFLPAPLYFGAAIEGACILDRIECGVAGDCLVYDSVTFRLTFLGIFLALKVLTFACYLAATIGVYRHADFDGKEDKYDHEKKNGDMKNGLEGRYNRGYDKEAEAGTQTDMTTF